MLALAALIVFVVTCSAVGLRLLWLGLHEGGGPAWSCGLGFVLIALLGYPLSTVAGVGTAPVGEVNHALGAAGALLTAAGLSSFFAFTLTVFRLRAPWAWALTVGAILVLAVAGFGQIGSLASADPSADSRQVVELWSRMVGTISVVCYAWLGIEGMLEWRKSRRRLALGLGDPVVSNRFLMWGLFGLSTTALSVFLLVLQVVAEHGSHGLAGQLALTLFGLVSSAAAALAFFPPAAYVERIRARAAG